MTERDHHRMMNGYKSSRIHLNDPNDLGVIKFKTDRASLRESTGRGRGTYRPRGSASIYGTRGGARLARLSADGVASKYHQRRA